MTEPIRREIRTCTPSTSIWQNPLTEEAFRRNAVDLALATGECPVDPDIGVEPSSVQFLYGSIPQRSRDTTLSPPQYVLTAETEHRLANDFALIAATQEAVFSVTAAAIEEHVCKDGNLEGITLRLAANEGISEPLRDSLQEIWRSITTSEARPIVTANGVFNKIIHLNRTRILQRVRKAVGHPPIFREKGRTRTNPDDKLLRAFKRMQKEKLTSVGRAFVERATDLNTELLLLLETVSVDEAEAASAEVITRLGDISKKCFDVTTTCDENHRLPFKLLLKVAGLDQRTWLRNKHVAEIDKIGTYWRIAQSLVLIHQQISANRQSKLTPVRLSVAGVQPYTSVTQGPSIQGRDMACYVHAEIQLLVHYLAESSQQRLCGPPPRVIGASKSACFLCFLFISCHGTFRSPLTHGRLYDQWTIPDLAEYNIDHVNDLRSTICLMNDAMTELRASYCLKRHRDHPMTSRTDLDRLSILTAESDIDEAGHAVAAMKDDPAGASEDIKENDSPPQVAHGVEVFPCLVPEASVKQNSEVPSVMQESRSTIHMKTQLKREDLVLSMIRSCLRPLERFLRRFRRGKEPKADSEKH
jgi:hypothetical protein